MTLKNTIITLLILNLIIFIAAFTASLLSKSMKLKKLISNSAIYLILSEMTVVWLFPIAWIVLSSFRKEKGADVPYIIPKEFTFDNYLRCFSDTVFPFKLWFTNTFVVAVFVCLFATMLTLCTAYVISRFRFKARKPIMNIAMILGMFPGFMSMIAVYYVLKAVNLTQTLTALILVYSAGAGLAFYISKGFFDTISKSLDEAAKIDGATSLQILINIILPMSRPIVVYTALTAFMGPWMDFIFVRIIMGDNSKKYTVAVGLFNLIDIQNVYEYFNMFCAGCVLVSIPIVILFIIMQRFYVEGVTSGSVK